VAAVLLLALLAPAVAIAQEAAEVVAEVVEEVPTIDSGNTAWILTSSALVLFMTIPGLSLFYGGLVRSRNVLSVLLQCFSITALCTVIWVVAGYSLAFANMPTQEAGVINLASFVGGLSKVGLLGVTPDSISGSIPELLFAMFQLTFFIITPALICGAYAERMKFSAVLIFTAFWSVLVYAPLCHMAWSGDGALFWDMGVLDFAGGTVVHINAGIAALVACLVLGKRDGYPTKPMPPHNLTMTVTGAGMLWVGWFGFNAGSAVAADGLASSAMLVTQVSTAMATLTWMGIEWLKHGKPSALGAVTGAVAGLVAITPAAGASGPLGALAIGFASAFICFFAATSMKKALGYDDSLDAFGVHGVGGIVGALLTGVFAAESLGGGGFGDGHETIVSQVTAQAISVGITILYSGIGSFIILKAIDLTLGLRVTQEEERQGLDVAQHGEEGYIL
jgi:Amt family ammonium transporter